MNSTKKIFVTLAIVISAINLSIAQTKAKEEPKVYNPEAKVVDEYANALIKAMSQKKHVLLEIGGNWCKWCLAFNKFTTTDHEVDSIIKSNYVVLHVNYSKENKNLPFLETLEYPQRMGFPVFVVVNSQGQRIHTQNSWYLEDGNEAKPGYDKKKTIAFLKEWSPSALDPKQYQEK